MAGERVMDDPVAMMMLMTVTLVGISLVNLGIWLFELWRMKNVDK